MAQRWGNRRVEVSSAAQDAGSGTVAQGWPSSEPRPESDPGTGRAFAYTRLVKPIVDRLLAALLLVLFVPVLLAVAVVIKVSIGSPVLFSQARVGRHGRVFRIYKFRSMRPDRRLRRDPYDGPERRLLHKTPHDPRLTRIGHLLRRLSLDELPQLWNVLRGDMSMVGPRPELVEIVERHYQPWQHERHRVKPGLTGLWQISARDEAPMYERTQLDLDYIDAMSFTTDMRILLVTVKALTGRNPGF